MWQCLAVSDVCLTSCTILISVSASMKVWCSARDHQQDASVRSCEVNGSGKTWTSYCSARFGSEIIFWRCTVVCISVHDSLDGVHVMAGLVHWRGRSLSRQVGTRLRINLLRPHAAISVFYQVISIQWLQEDAKVSPHLCKWGCVLSFTPRRPHPGAPAERWRHRWQFGKCWCIQ